MTTLRQKMASNRFFIGQSPIRLSSLKAISDRASSPIRQVRAVRSFAIQRLR